MVSMDKVRATLAPVKEMAVSIEQLLNEEHHGAATILAKRMNQLFMDAMKDLEISAVNLAEQAGIEENKVVQAIESLKNALMNPQPKPDPYVRNETPSSESLPDPEASPDSTG